MNPGSRLTESLLVTTFLEGLQMALGQLARDKSDDEVLRLWGSDRAWTHIMLGDGTTHTHLEPLIVTALSRVRRAIEGVGCRGAVVHEWMNVDKALVSDDTIWGEQTSKHYYPKRFYVLVEHENNQHWNTELWKLLHLRAPLKVLIGYQSRGFDRWVKEEAVGHIIDAARWMGSQVFDPGTGMGTGWPETYLMISGTWPSEFDPTARRPAWMVYALAAPRYDLRTLPADFTDYPT